MSVSLHAVTVSSQIPVTALHWYRRQAVLAEQTTFGVYTHWFDTQSSLVQLLLSLHSAAIAAADFFRVPQPSTVSQNAS
jgi:hypothetical protein